MVSNVLTQISCARNIPTFGCRIPETLADGRLERRVGVSLDPARSHLMLCGHSGMIVDTMQILEQRGMRRHRRREPGHISAEKYH